MEIFRGINAAASLKRVTAASLYHQIANGSTVCAVWVVRIRSEFRRAFRSAGRVSTCGL